MRYQRRVTQRQRQVIRLVAQGYSYQEIAKELQIAVATVSAHMATLYVTLEVRNAPAAVAACYERRILLIPDEEGMVDHVRVA